MATIQKENFDQEIKIFLKLYQKKQRPTNNLWIINTSDDSRDHVSPSCSLRDTFLRMFTNKNERQLIVEIVNVLIYNTEFMRHDAINKNLKFMPIFSVLNNRKKRIHKLPFFESIGFAMDSLDTRITNRVTLQQALADGEYTENEVFLYGLDLAITLFTQPSFDIIIATRDRANDPGPNFDGDLALFALQQKNLVERTRSHINDASYLREFHDIVVKYLGSEANSGESQSNAEEFYRRYMFLLYATPNVIFTQRTDWIRGPRNLREFASDYLENKCNLQPSSREFNDRLYGILKRNPINDEDKVQTHLWYLEITQFCNCSELGPAYQFAAFGRSLKYDRYSDVFPCCLGNNRNRNKAVWEPSSDLKRYAELMRDILTYKLQNVKQTELEEGRDRALRCLFQDLCENGLLANEKQRLFPFFLYNFMEGLSELPSKIDLMRGRMRSIFGEDFWAGFGFDHRYHELFRQRFEAIHKI